MPDKESPDVGSIPAVKQLDIIGGFPPLHPSGQEILYNEDKYRVNDSKFDQREANPELSIVIPAYLEAENLHIILPRLKKVLESIEPSYEILVIDTPTPLDETQSVCVQFGAKYINRSPGSCFGDAVRTGLKKAQGEWILCMDADGSHAPEFIPNLYARKDAADIVIASRYIKGGFTENSLPLILMSRILNLTYAIVLNLKCKDVSNSFKLYRADLLKPLNLYCQNFDIIEEILYKIMRNNPNARIIEVPFSFKKRLFGETKRNLLIFILTYVFTMVKLRFSK
jgi:dolichol-phosphate mannosyltransferase